MGAGWRPIGHVGQLPPEDEVRRLIAWLTASCGLSPRELWETGWRDLSALAKAAVAREKRLMARWR